MANNLMGITAYKKFIHGSEWKIIRNKHLRHEPLCRFCKQEGRVTPANQVDHIVPCLDNPALQRDPLNLRSLCAYHHGPLRHDAGRGYSNIIGVDGSPVDESHPFNRVR
jgi:5-methylcytosine-specific restriction protein A